MNLNHVHLRRAELLQRIARQRSQIETLAQALKPAAHYYDQGHALAVKLKRHPVATALGGVLLSVLVFRKMPLRKLGTTAFISLLSWWQASHQSKPPVDP